MGRKLPLCACWATLFQVAEARALSSQTTWPFPPQAVPNVVEIDTTIKIAGGINSPLIVRTTDNYGRVQRQLCKCNDDLRQVSPRRGSCVVMQERAMDCRKRFGLFLFTHKW